jgi:hypothetical protein
VLSQLVFVYFQKTKNFFDSHKKKVFSNWWTEHFTPTNQAPDEGRPG